MCKNKFSEEEWEAIREEYVGYSYLELQDEIRLVEKIEPFDEPRYEILNELIGEATNHELLDPDY